MQTRMRWRFGGLRRLDRPPYRHLDEGVFLPRRRQPPSPLARFAVPFLRQQLEHLRPDLGAARVAVALGVSDDLDVGAQLVRAVGAGTLSTIRDARRMISRISATSASIRSIGASIRTASWTGAISLIPCRVARMQAIRRMSAPADCTGQLRIERSLSSRTPVRHVQPIAVRITPVCIAC